MSLLRNQIKMSDELSQKIRKLSRDVTICAELYENIELHELLNDESAVDALSIINFALSTKRLTVDELTALSAYDDYSVWIDELVHYMMLFKMCGFDDVRQCLSDDFYVSLTQVMLSLINSEFPPSDVYDENATSLFAEYKRLFAIRNLEIKEFDDVYDEHYIGEESLILGLTLILHDAGFDVSKLITEILDNGIKNGTVTDMEDIIDVSLMCLYHLYLVDVDPTLHLLKSELSSQYEHYHADLIYKTIESLNERGELKCQY